MVDSFFQEVIEQQLKTKIPVEKRVVGRDGVVPKLQKNIEKEFRFKQRKLNGATSQDQDSSSRPISRPLKINPNSYRVSKHKMQSNLE